MNLKLKPLRETEVQILNWFDLVISLALVVVIDFLQLEIEVLLLLVLHNFLDPKANNFLNKQACQCEY
jgi:hypothetical protein